jgi:hypothetical protein
MNPRINKKIHKRYLADIGIECTLDQVTIDKLENLEINGIVHLSNENFPESFYKLNQGAYKYVLQFCAKRVNFSEVPKRDSGWWSINNWTHFFVFYSKEYSESKWYVATNKAKKL